MFPPCTIHSVCDSNYKPQPGQINHPLPRFVDKFKVSLTYASLLFYKASRSRLWWVPQAETADDTVNTISIPKQRLPYSLCPSRRPSLGRHCAEYRVGGEHPRAALTRVRRHVCSCVTYTRPAQWKIVCAVFLSPVPRHRPLESDGDNEPFRRSPAAFSPCL